MLTFKTIHNLAPLTFRNLYLWKTLGVGTILDQMTANFLTFHYGGRVGGGGAKYKKYIRARENKMKKIHVRQLTLNNIHAMA